MEGRRWDRGKPRTIFRIVVAWTNFVSIDVKKKKKKKKGNNIGRDVSGARVPKIILFDLLRRAEHRCFALTSLNSIVKCNYIFDQLGSMFSIVLLFFSLSLSLSLSLSVCITLILARWYLITFSINVKMYVGCCLFSNRWKGFFASWMEGRFFLFFYVFVSSFQWDWICEFNYGMDGEFIYIYILDNIN